MNEASLNSAERVASLFQQDTLLPAQYFDTFRRKSFLEPEKRLMLAVLQDAIAGFQKHVRARDVKGKALFQDIEKWIAGENDEGLFSFETICESLGCDPRYIRKGLANWKRARLRARPKANVYRPAPRGRRKKRNFLSVRESRPKRFRAAGR